MRRALSLFALAGSLFMAAGQLTVDTVKAVETDAVDKDSWSFKGQISDAITFNALEALVMAGISVELENDGNTLDTVDFTEDDCKFLNNERGVTCKIKGASLSVKLFTRTIRTKAVTGAAIESYNKNNTSHGDNKNKTSHDGKDGKGDLVRVTETFWRVRGTFRRREFADDLDNDGLRVTLATLPAFNEDCTEKTLAHGQTRVTCVPLEA